MKKLQISEEISVGIEVLGAIEERKAVVVLLILQKGSESIRQRYHWWVDQIGKLKIIMSSSVSKKKTKTKGLNSYSHAAANKNSVVIRSDKSKICLTSKEFDCVKKGFSSLIADVLGKYAKPNW